MSETRNSEPLASNAAPGCESILLNTHWVLVVMDQFTRRIIGFGVHAGDVDGVALCRMFNAAISTKGVPKYLSTDPLFTYHQWTANLRILDVDELKSIPYTPCSHPFIERLIETIRVHMRRWTVTRPLNSAVTESRNLLR